MAARSKEKSHRKNKMLRRIAVCLGIAGSLSSAIARAQDRVPLPPEAVVKDVEMLALESTTPSPDGKWVVFEAGDPTKPMRFDYPGQRYTKSGFAMNAGAQAFSIWVTEVSTGQAIQITSPQGSSWEPNWSPDSKYLAFYSDRSGQAALWVWNRETRAARQVSTAFIHTGWWRERPEWTADGKSVLCKILPEGTTLDDLLDSSPIYKNRNAAATAAAAPEGKLKTASVHVYSSHPEPKPKPKDDVTNAPDNGKLEDAEFYDVLYLTDLAQIDIATGKVTRLLKRVRPMCYAYSPDGTRILFLNLDGTVPHTQQIGYSVLIYDLRTRSTTTVVDRGYFDANNLTTRATWSPDGKRIAYSDTGRTAERAAYVVTLQSGAKVKVSAQIPASSLNFEWGPPMWDRASEHVYLLDSSAGRLWEASADGQTVREVVKVAGATINDLAVDEAASIYWSNDGGNTLYVRAHDTNSKKDALYSVRLDSGEATKLYENDEYISMREMGALTGVNNGGAKLIYESQSASRPEDVWALDLNTRQPTPLSNLNPQYASATLGQVRIIEWLSLQGEQLHGTLLLPGGYHQGERYPMVVWVYGGDNGSDKGNRFAFGWGSAFNPQMWASRGYAVLYPDVPLHPGTPIDDLVSAVIPGVNKAVELGVADADRLALMGQSFGGYNTISLLTRTSIFKAAVAMSAASSDLFEAYTHFEGGIAPWTGYYEEGQGGMKGSPWEFRERYFNNSPMFFLDRVTTPLLIERGLMDYISIQSGNVFNSLHTLGKEAEFLEYDHEEHVLQQPANVIDFWNRRIAWVDRFLRPVDAASITTPGTPVAP